MCLGVFHLGFILFGTLCVSWTWVIISFPILGKFSTIFSSSIFSWSFFLSSSPGTPIIRMVSDDHISLQSLCLIFVNSINMCLGVFHLGFILFGTLWVSWTWVTVSFPILGKFSTLISSCIFSWSFFLSSSSGIPMIWMLGHLTLFLRSLRLSSFLLIRFSFFLSIHLFLPFYLLLH